MTMYGCYCINPSTSCLVGVVSQYYETPYLHSTFSRCFENENTFCLLEFHLLLKTLKLSSLSPYWKT